MRHFVSLPASAFALAMSAPAAAQVGDFRLPPAPTPTPTPSAQGPVDPTQPRRPAPTPSPVTTRTATPTPAPVLTPVPQPSATRGATPIPRATAIRPSAPSPLPSRQPGSAAPVITPSPQPSLPGDQPASLPGGSPTPSFPTGAATPGFTQPAAQAEADTTGDSMAWWIWLLAGLGIGIAGAAGFYAWKLRRPGGAEVAVPQIVRPNVAVAPIARPDAAPAPAPAPTPAKPAMAAPRASAGPLSIELAPRTLSLTLVAATLAYRLELTNEGSAPLENVVVEADLTTAHAARPAESQLANRDTVLEVRHRLDRIEAGETREVSGELRLPLTQVQAMKQGSNTLFVPLARFTARANGHAALLNAVVGGPGAQGGIAPVLVDRGPHILRNLVVCAF